MSVAGYRFWVVPHTHWDREWYLPFEQLYEEGERLMNVGLHCRIVGRPGRARALERFLDHVRAHEGVWVATRADIARHWHAIHGA